MSLLQTVMQGVLSIVNMVQRRRLLRASSVVSVMPLMLFTTLASCQTTKPIKHKSPLIRTINELQTDIHVYQSDDQINSGIAGWLDAMLMLQAPARQRTDAMPFLYRVSLEDISPADRQFTLFWISPDKRRIPPFDVLNLRGNVVGRFPGIKQSHIPLTLGDGDNDTSLWTRGMLFIPVYKGEKASAVPDANDRWPKIRLSVKSLREVSGVRFLKPASHCLPRFVGAIRGKGVRIKKSKVVHPYVPLSGQGFGVQTVRTLIKASLKKGMSSKAVLLYFQHHKFKRAPNKDKSIIYAVRNIELHMLGKVPVLVVVDVGAKHEV